MHSTFASSKDAPISRKDLVTSTNQSTLSHQKCGSPKKLLASPFNAPTNIRTTTRFDYQPDICKRLVFRCGIDDLAHGPEVLLFGHKEHSIS
jgi:hypothetical protein